MRNRTTRKIIRGGANRLVSQENTRRVGRRQSTVVEPNQATTLGTLAPGVILLGEYIVRSTLHPHETSFPGVFRCQTREGREVLVKVAPTQHPPKPDMWMLLPKLDHPNIVRTLHVIERDGLFYEIQEFCEGGSLSDCIGNRGITPEWIGERLVPQVNEGLKYLHSMGIVHRDVKPSNLYLRENDLNGTIVLGDFDISSVLVSDRTSRHTSRMAGTWAYSAPEGFPRFTGDGDNIAAARITRTADYYSFGISIIETMTGTTSLHSCALPDLYDFYLAGGRVELPDAPPRMLLLLKGLLVRNRHERWSGAEVDRWLRGANVREDMQAVINDQRFSLAKATRPYSLGDAQAVDLPSLALAMERHPGEAKSHLLESDVLTKWIANQDATVAHKVERSREKYRHHPDLALYRCIMHCDPNRPLDIPDYGSIGSPAEWAPLLAERASTEKHLHSGPVSDAQLERLEAWLELKVPPAGGMAARVAEIRHRPVTVRFEELAFLFDRKLGYSGQVSAFQNLRRDESDRQVCYTPAQVVAEAFGPASGWESVLPACFRSARDRWQQGFLEAWMRQRGMLELATKAGAASSVFQANIDEKFDVFLRHLDPWAEKPQIVFEESTVKSELVMEYGAQSAVTISYRTIGPGIPMGSVKLVNAPPRVTLDNFKILGRSGKVGVGIQAKGGGSRDFRQDSFRIEVDRGNFWMEGDGVAVRYRIVFALTDTLKRAVLGGAIGAVVLGGSRFFATLFLPRLVDSQNIVGNNLGPQIEPVAYIGGSAICIAGIYGVFRVWLEAYKESGR